MGDVAIVSRKSCFTRGEQQKSQSESINFVVVIPELHKNATFSGLLQFAPGPAFFQNAVSQADGGGAGVALAPHLAAERANLLVILHGESSLAYAFEVRCHVFLEAT